MLRQSWELATAVSLAFAVPFWLMVFANTYRHFPKMEPKKRLSMSIRQATALSLILLAIVFISLWALMDFVAR
ncbi:MAG: hypothetical protein N3E51_03470 [Candidatus Micrarchaeota archaeon]|nr:hypothetical protein [Candidatus Micrarchaeota archaeon]